MEDIFGFGIWLGFACFLVIALSADTFLLHDKIKHPHHSVRAAASWTCVWIATALIFNVILWLYLYRYTTVQVANQKSLEFFTGYLIEKSLSIDNLFVFYMIFKQFRIPVSAQQRVLTIGIWSAVIMRLIFIVIGVMLIERFHWLLYVMGAFLIFTGIKMCIDVGEEKDIMASKALRWLKRHLRVTHELEGERFFVRRNALLYVTPLFLVLALIEFSDLMFAFDSIPAIFSITHDPFIVWTSNIFAILGLRAIYFMLPGMVNRFHLLEYGIALILVFVGLKMLIESWIEISALASLGVIISILVLFSVLSIWHRQYARHK